MKWEKVTSTIGHSAFTLWNNGRKLVTLVFNPSSNAARLESGDEKRVFLIRKEGFLKNRTVLRNEYGVEIGRAGSENNRPYIDIDNQRFFYEMDESSAHSSLSIYSAAESNAPLAVCEIDSSDPIAAPVRSQTGFDSPARYSLLMALCWYLLPLVRNNNVDVHLV